MSSFCRYGAFVNAPLSHLLYDLMNRVVERLPRYQTIAQLALSNLVVLPIQNYVYLLRLEKRRT